jgi:hypothetical protein
MAKAEVNGPNNLSDRDNTTHRAASNRDNDDFKKMCLFFAMFLIPLLFVFVVCVAYADRIAILNQSGLKEDPSLMAELRSLKLEVQKIAPSLNAPSTRIESVSTPSQGWIPSEQQGAISAADCLTGLNLAPYLTPGHLTHLLCTIPCIIQSRIRFNQTGTFGERSQDESLEVYEAECAVWRMKECDGVVIPLTADKDAYGREFFWCKIEGSLHWYLEMGKVVIEASPFIIIFVTFIYAWVEDFQA